MIQCKIPYWKRVQGYVVVKGKDLDECLTKANNGDIEDSTDLETSEYELMEDEVRDIINLPDKVKNSREV